VIIPLVRKLVAAGEKVIVFRENKPKVRATAEYLGIPADVMWLGSTLKRSLERGDYLNLRRAGLGTIQALEGADDAVLARAVKSDTKIRRIRGALADMKTRAPLGVDDLPMPTPAA